jgi:CheY-like chemotaxis protein
MMGRRSILLIEDNPGDTALILRAFKKAGLEDAVEVVSDGAAALELLASRDEGTMPVAILLDLKLPKVSGLEVLRQIRAGPKTRSIPVIALTSSDERQDILASYLLGANSYVRKPVNIVEFSQVVTQVGQYWAKVNEPVPHSSEVPA